MNSEIDMVIPVGNRRGVLLRAVVGSAAMGLAIALIVAIALAATGDLAVGDSSSWLLLLLAPAFLAGFGAVQAAWWQYKLGPIRYEADGSGLRVMHRASVLHQWTWPEIHKLRLTGEVSWHSFIVYKNGTSDFPRLVIHSDEGVVTTPSVLLWGRAATRKLERRLVEMHRTSSH